MGEHKVFVGSLSWDATEKDLENYFGKFGTVQSTKIIFDRATGRSKGFGFVEFNSSDEVQRAINEGNGGEIDGRAIAVSEANKQGGGGGGGFGGGGGRGGGGGF